MTGWRRTLAIAVAAVAGLVLAAALTTAASSLSGQSVGLSSEPLTAGEGLAPAETATPRRPDADAARPTPRPTRTPHAAPDPRPPTPRPTSTAAADDGRRQHGSGGGGDDDSRAAGAAAGAAAAATTTERAAARDRGRRAPSASTVARSSALAQDGVAVSPDCRVAGQALPKLSLRCRRLGGRSRWCEA